MKDHEFRELVNQLRDIAVEYRDTQQLRERIAHTVRAALQSGNSGQLNRANLFTDDELMGMAHGDNPVANAYRELLEFRRNAAGGNSAQPVTVPDGYVLVPVEPTVAMRKAFHQANDEAERFVSPDHQWQAMLDAVKKGA